MSRFDKVELDLKSIKKMISISFRVHLNKSFFFLLSKTPTIESFINI